MPPAIETRALGKIFNKRRTIRDILTHPFRKPGSVRALEEVSLEVRPGEIFGLLGPNGAGKTTLLKILSSLITPTTGAAFIQGHDVAASPHAVKSSIGLVTSDERSFYWRLSGRENLHFFASLYNVPRERVRSRCQALLEKMEMADKADQHFMEYSTGTKQRLAIARALLHDPPILFMDEPTRSLDPTASKHLRAFIVETLNRKEGKTILLATHNLPEAEDLCGRLAILHLARIRRMGTVPEVRSWGSTRERYVIEIGGEPSARLAGDGGALAFEGCRIEPLPDGIRAAAAPYEGPKPAALLAEVEKGGAALTELLRRLIGSGATVVSCARREASLQEVFDLVASEGPEETPGRGDASPGSGEGSAGREGAR